MSSLCLHYKNHHKKIAQIWLRSLQKAEVSHRLTLIYLANDIVQNAKRKSAISFIDDFKSILKETVPYLRDDKIKKSVERVFSIWQDRAIFDAKFTADLKNSLNGSGRTSTSNTRTSSQQSVTTATSEKDVKKLLDDYLARQRRLIKESEDELQRYKNRLQHIQKLRDDYKL